MGTSTNRRGPKPSIPLLPDWINESPMDESPDDQPAPLESEPESVEQEENTTDSSSQEVDAAVPNESQALALAANRFNACQRGFQKAVKTNDFTGLKRVVKTYVSQALGGARTGAQRMSRSGKAIVTFGSVLSDIRQNGLANTLTNLQLGQYVGQPVLTVLSALMGHVCGASALLDDAITKEAYADTITRVVEEMPGLDLENLNEAQVGEMLAIFLEQSIVLRLICDIGRSQTVATSDPVRSIRIQEELYQIVNGLVHSSIVPQLRMAMSVAGNLSQEIQRIYRIAFNAIVGPTSL